MQPSLTGSHTASARMLAISIEIAPGDASSSNAGQPGTPSLPSVVSPVVTTVVTIEVAPTVVVASSMVPGAVEPVLEDVSSSEEVAPLPQAVTAIETSSERQ